MIKNISAGKNIAVNGGIVSSLYFGSSGVGAGNMRYNPNSQNIEVFDGNVWQQMPSAYTTIELTNEVNDLLDWARKKRDEEMNWQNLAENNKAVKIALDNLEEARRQLEITTKLVKEHEQTTS